MIKTIKYITFFTLNTYLASIPFKFLRVIILTIISIALFVLYFKDKNEPYTGQYKWNIFYR